MKDVGTVETDMMDALGAQGERGKGGPVESHRRQAQQAAVPDDLEWLVVPPLMLGQCRLVRQQGRPFAFVSWAMVDDETAARLASGQIKLRPSDWRSGEQAWIIDVIAPFGGGEAALKEVKDRMFAGKTVKALQPAPDGQGMAVVEW